MRRNAARSASGATFCAAWAGHFEDVVDSVDDGEVFVFRDPAVRIELLEFGLFFGQVVVVFPEAEGFAVQAGERVEEANVVERYDYLYSRDELEPWVERIKQVSDKAKQTFVIANNHARGQSLVNAFEVMALIDEQRVPGPARLVESYPRLSESVEPDDESAQGELF